MSESDTDAGDDVFTMIKPPVLTDMPDLSTTKDTQMTLRVEKHDYGRGGDIQETKNIELHSVYDYKNYSDEFGIIRTTTSWRG